VAANASSLSLQAVAVDFEANDTTHMQQPTNKLVSVITRAAASEFCAMFRSLNWHPLVLLLQHWLLHFNFKVVQKLLPLTLRNSLKLLFYNFY